MLDTHYACREDPHSISWTKRRMVPGQCKSTWCRHSTSKKNDQKGPDVAESPESQGRQDDDSGPVQGFLTSDEIVSMASKLNVPVEIIMRDQITKPKLNMTYVLNLDTSGNPGTHWVMYRRMGKSNENRGSIFYFDPFGRPPPNELVKFGPITYSDDQVQDPESSHCGYFVMLVAYWLNESLMSNLSSNDALQAVEKSLNETFERPLINNDAIVRDTLRLLQL